MNRIDICKNIIQSIKEYITNSDKLEPHRAQNYFIFMLLMVLNSNFQIFPPAISKYNFTSTTIHQYHRPDYIYNSPFSVLPLSIPFQ